MASAGHIETSELSEKELQILDAVLAVVGRDGIAGVSMRAVAREAKVALGLMNYYFDDKTSLIAAALRRIGEQDTAIVEPVGGLSPAEQLRHALRIVVGPDYLGRDYLSQRLALWSLASTNDLYGDINQRAQAKYRAHLARLIEHARPELSAPEIAARAADILIIQNGIWLTSILLPEPEVVERSVQRCEQIAFS